MMCRVDRFIHTSPLTASKIIKTKLGDRRSVTALSLRHGSFRSTGSPMVRRPRSLRRERGVDEVHHSQRHCVNKIVRAPKVVQRGELSRTPRNGLERSHHTKPHRHTIPHPLVTSRLQLPPPPPRNPHLLPNRQIRNNLLAPPTHNHHPQIPRHPL